ncbi:TOM (translocase of outer membrane) complex component [Paecilomyces lecythidis]|uniref:TOM (Translocase of outer membrane) complex component n=1 Tax=Paecilomyces lecythidis TaxID=3004212 RepID=A0ABR3WWA5_9EURO
MSGRHAVVTLHPVYSPDTLPFRSLTFASDEDSISIGRSSKCLSKNLVPAHNNAWFESRVMSRDHARLGVRLEKETVYVRDNGSMHGTSLNDKKIPTGRDISVHSGDILTFGNEVTRGSETFAPLKVRCDCQWFDNNDKEASEPPEKLPSKPFTNSFSVPDDDSVIEVDHDTSYKRVTTFTVPDSDDDSEADSAHPKDQSTPATSPLSKDAVDECTRGDAETSSPKPKPAAYESDRDEDEQKIPVNAEEDQAPVTPTMTPQAAFSPCAFSDNEEWEGDEINSSEEDSESQMSEEPEDDEDADASCSSDESFEEGFANNHTHATNKSYTPPPAAYATTLSAGPCINEWAGPSDADYIQQRRHCRFPNGAFVADPSTSFYGYSDGPFMFDHARSSNENARAMDSVVLPGPSTLVDNRGDQVMDEQRWKALPDYNSIGRPVLPSFTNLPFFPQRGNVAGNEKETLGLENATERRSGESTATTRVSIADIVHDCKPSEPRASLKRKAAEMELESVVSVPSYFDEFSELPRCGESIRDDQLESVFGDVASLPDAQPQLPIDSLDSSPPELTKIAAAPEEQSAENTVSDNGHLRKRAKLTHAAPRRRKLARDAAVALGGVVVGSILTVAGLASLPADFFTG